MSLLTQNIQNLIEIRRETVLRLQSHSETHDSLRALEILGGDYLMLDVVKHRLMVNEVKQLSRHKCGMNEKPKRQVHFE